MTKKNALEIAVSALSTDTTNEEVIEVLNKMIAQLDKPRSANPEKTAAANAKRKEATATARAELIAQVAPVLRKHLATDITAKDLYTAAASELPADFTAAKVQNILIRELAPELVKTESKGNPNTYRLA